MRLTPQEPEIPEVGGFTEANDIFGYRDFADRLANLVRNIDEPLVIVLDGPWGSGKSIFVKQWAGLLRERGASVIHFDAFQSDHYEDAFLALSAEIHATAKKTLGGNESTTRRYLTQGSFVTHNRCRVGISRSRTRASPMRRLIRMANLTRTLRRS